MTAPFGPREFQLVLLRRMADHQPGLVEEARQELSASAAEMREANRRWQAMVRAPGGRGALRWPVPLWPDLRFEVMVAPGGAVWNEWLVRAPGAPGPELRTVEDLRPWSGTVDEVARAFPPARPMEGGAPTRWALAITAPGTGEPYVAEFTWGLFQRLLPG
ncbi:hypothetical protein [Streptomyces sp. NPDC088928]|uniref:hypothetical protein n=1 Tax=Streptomyces sp. NPDC088928 TaxID=3365915 RepID=UPI0037F27161